VSGISRSVLCGLSKSLHLLVGMYHGFGYGWVSPTRRDAVPPSEGGNVGEEKGGGEIGDAGES